MINEAYFTKQRVSVLLLEDSAVDVFLFKRLIGETSVVADLHVVASVSQCLQVLLNTKVDIIFVDLNVEDSQGIDTFLQVFSTRPNIPIVVLSGVMDQKVALQTVREGAQNFLVKGDFNEYVLERTILFGMQRKKILDVADQSVQNYKTLFHSNPVPLIAVDLEKLEIRMANHALLNATGFSYDEVLKLSLSEFFVQGQIHTLQPNVESKDTAEKNFVVKRKDGLLIQAEVVCQHIYFDEKLLTLIAIHDVTEKKQTLALLNHSQRRLNLAISSGRMIVLDINFVTGVFEFHSTSRDKLNLVLSQAKDLDAALRLVHPEDRRMVSESYDRSKFGENRVVQFRIVHPKSEDILWIEHRHNLVFDSEGAAIASHGVLIDITELKKIQNHLYESYRHLETAASQQASILNALPAHIAILNADGIIINVNDSWKNFADENGLNDTSYCIGESYFKHLAPSSEVEEIYSGIKEVISGKRSEFTTEYSCHSPDEQRWFKAVVSPLPIGDATGAVIMHVNITDRKQAEEDVRKSEERFRALIEHSGDLFTITNSDNLITYSSPNFKRLFSLSPDDFHNRKFEELVHQDDVANYRLVIARVIESARLFHHIYRLRNGHGNYIWVEGTFVNLFHIPAVNGIVSNFRDITEKIKTETALYQNNYILEKANEVAKIGYWRSDIGEDPELIWSPQLHRIFGVKESAFGKRLSSFLAVIHPDDQQKMKDAIRTAVESSKEFNINLRVIRPDGKEIWVNQQAEVFHNDDGKPVSMIGVAKDITEQKANEDKLRQTQNNLYGLINNTPDLIWSIDNTYNLLSANKAFKEGCRQQYGVVVEEGDSVFFEQHSSRERSEWRKFYDRALEGERVHTEIPIDFGGAQVFFEISLNPMYHNDVVAGVSCFARDVSEKKKAETEIRAINERYQILSKATNDAIWDWDIGHDTLHWNIGVKTIFGYEFDQEMTTLQWWKENVHPDDLRRVEKQLKVTFEKKSQIWHSQYRFRCKDGSYKHVSDRGFAIYEDDMPVRMIGAMQDVHELTEYRMSLEHKVSERTRELQRALEKEKELAELKSRFVAIASHEFRTPLSTIQFASDFLSLHRRGISEAEIDKKLKSISNQVDHMMSLLDDVLTVGRGESGKIAVSKSSVNVKSFVLDLVANVKVAAKSQHIVRTHFDLGVETCDTDEKLLFNIFSNLLSNAIKFSPGEREVFLYCKTSEDFLLVEICDNGIGIKADEADLIFQPFNRGSNAGAIAGTGLGLTIVKTATSLLGGSLSVRTGEKFKTIFEVKIPLTAV